MAFYYYLRVANAMFMGKATCEEPVSSPSAMRLALGITAAATVVIGLFPNLFIQAVNWSVTGLNPGGIALLR